MSCSDCGMPCKGSTCRICEINTAMEEEAKRRKTTDETDDEEEA